MKAKVSTVFLVCLASLALLFVAGCDKGENAVKGMPSAQGGLTKQDSALIAEIKGMGLVSQSQQEADRAAEVREQAQQTETDKKEILELSKQQEAILIGLVITHRTIDQINNKFDQLGVPHKKVQVISRFVQDGRTYYNHR